MNCLPQVPVSLHWLTKKFSSSGCNPNLQMNWIRWFGSSLGCLTKAGSDCGVQTFLADIAKPAESTSKSLINSCARRTRSLITVQQTVNCTLSSFLINISEVGSVAIMLFFNVDINDSQHLQRLCFVIDVIDQLCLPHYHCLLKHHRRFYF